MDINFIASLFIIGGFLTAWIWHYRDTERYEKEHRELMITLHTQHEDLMVQINKK